MRQIPVCAWLLITCSFVACGGEEFSSSDAGGAANAAPSGQAGAASGGDDGPEGPPAGNSGTTSVTAPGGRASTGGRPSGGASGGGGEPTIGAGGATSSEGGASDLECASGSITFRMLPGPDVPEGYFCDTGCGSGWLTLTDAEGYTAFSISSACGIASCESCEAAQCAAAACLPTPLGPRGAELVWTGTHLSKDTCGQNQACQRQTCAAPGKYKAKACANVSAGISSEAAGTCAAKSAQACAEVTFDFPAEGTVDLVLKEP